MPQLRTLSNRADLISGGDALLEVMLPADATAEQVHVKVAGKDGIGKDVSSQFAKRSNGRIIGVLTGLDEGSNRVTVDVGGQRASSLFITNHKIGGPVFAGPKVNPFVCAQPDWVVRAGDNFVLANASGLSGAPSTDGQCNIATEVKLYYRSTLPPATTNPPAAGTCLNVRPDPLPVQPPNPPPAAVESCFKPYSSSVAASDIAQITTDAGVAAPFIVRVERGTVNRGIYDIAVLFDPAADNVNTGWKPYAPQRGWNGKVVYSFGASSGQPRLQFRSEQSWNNEELALSKGFLVAINSMTDSLYNSNRVMMTETLMMMKEKIIDTYGEVRYTIGDGCSGGSINQVTSASIYPGLLDGIQPTCTYPDSETTAMEVIDCLQLIHAYSSAAWATLMTGKTQPEIDAKKAAINGHVDPLGCRAWVTSFANVGKPGQYSPFVVDRVTGILAPPGPPITNNCGLPEDLVYNPDTKPDGVRCTGADNAISIWGKATGTTRARTTTDNVGIQYGLKAYLSGAITAEEFVTVNEQAGGIDADVNFTTTRTAADPDALAIAYRAGIVSDGRQLAKTAIIDLRGYDDSAIHHVWRSFALRARLDAANGNHNNYVMWRYGTGLLAPAASGLTPQAFAMMDSWVGAMMKDTASTTVEARVAKNKPTMAVDFCYLTTDTTFSTKVTDAAMCDTDPRLKPHSSPRQVAGGPLVENILKCQLRPFNVADYAAATEALTDDQINRLKAVFPTGVCDYSKAGVGQQPAISPLDFSAGPGGVPLPPPPTTKGG